MKQITKFKRLLSGVLSAVMTVSAVPIVSAYADESTEPYPYTMFAASSDDGAITVNAGNFCVNGNVATNGTIVSSGNMNINGTRTEHANESMLYVLKKLNYSYFSDEIVETYTENYVLEDLNININNPIDVDGTIELTGNINLNSGIKAVDDVTINGDVKNSNNAVICSETGDINIDTSNVSFNGLIYAPYGDIVIDSDNLNLNNVVIIGQTITIDCPNVNANYSNSMAELIGNESNIDVELYAMGSYNADVNAIDIEWFTNYTNSSYEVLYSDDNKNYTSVATITDATTYQYLITEDFQKRYFKISLVTNHGEVIESIPFVVAKSEDSYEVDFLDSDEDGLPDIYEIMIGTDVNLPDTDGDALTDYQEIYITGTDPTIYDSVVAGISDADADSDEDGLSNFVEITMGTNPQKADTDDDGLNDSEESTYNTDPLNPDSDGDTLPDGDEPHIGLDPTNPETFDVPDAEYVVSQTIPANSDALRNINTDDSPYTVSLVVDATGYVEGNLTAKETRYAKAISNDAILGIAPEFSCKKNCDVKQATITFSIKNDYVNNEASAFPDEPELQGLKRFMIFSYIEDMNMLLPVETSYDLENNAIYTNTSGLGTYCIMDMEKWLVNLGIEPDNTLEPLRLQQPLMLSKRINSLTSNESFSEADTQITHTEEVTETESTDESDTSSTSLPTLKFAPTKLLASKPRGEVTVQNPLDLVFLFQINGDLPSIFESQKEMIIADCEDAFEAYNDVRVYLIGYEVNNAKFLKTYNGHTDMNAYYSNIEEVRAALNSVTYVQTSEYCNRGAAFTKMINEVVFRDNAGKFVFQIMNGSTTVNASYFSELDACARGNINYSEVMPSGYHYISSEYGARVNTAITDTGGLNLTYGSDTEVKIYEHIVDNIAPPHIEFNVIIPTGWKDISLVDVISPDNHAKSDSDNLTDWEEIDTESGLITWDNNGNIQLPTFKKCLEAAADRGYNVISEYNNTVPSYMRSYFYNEEILPIHSNPCDDDTDGDSLLDGTPQYHWYNSDGQGFRRQIAPTDPDPMAYTGPANLWSTQIDQMENGVVSHEYGGDNGLEGKINKNIAESLVKMLLKFRTTINDNGDTIRKAALFIKKHMEGSTAAGAYLLNFVRDENNIAYHSQPDTWQRNFGYNELYDDVFRIGSYMNYGRVDFNVSGDIYSLWAWKGDYWNLQSGAEVGLYVYNDTYSGTPQYDVVDFEVPMTLSLYNYLGSGEYENLYNWVPIIDQWWVTGFAPEYSEPNPEIMISVASINLSEHEELFNSILEADEIDDYYDELKRDHLIFDKNTKTVWVQWYNESVA